LLLLSRNNAFFFDEGEFVYDAAIVDRQLFVISEPGAGCPISRVLCEKWGFSVYR